jgi:hypothetical protein
MQAKKYVFLQSPERCTSEAFRALRSGGQMYHKSPIYFKSSIVAPGSAPDCQMVVAINFLSWDKLCFLFFLGVINNCHS